jgi:hypothetical protein
MNVQKFFDTLFYLYGKQNHVKINYTLKKEPRV